MKAGLLYILLLPRGAHARVQRVYRSETRVGRALEARSHAGK